MPRPDGQSGEYRPDWSGLLEAALTIEGSTGNTYSRLYNYSMGNRALLMYQGVIPQPVATFNRWKEVDRHVKRGAKAKAILRPITVKLRDEVDEEGNPKTMTRFKLVNSVFPISDTEGEPLPELELPQWSKARALATLAITEVPFQTFNGNVQGYSFGRNIAINPAAKYPVRTTAHELGHIVSGHTSQDALAEYEQHRGVFEFEAEGTAHLVLNEIGQLDSDVASVSRAYLQGWMGQQKPTEKSVRTIFKATDAIVNAGREKLPE